MGTNFKPDPRHDKTPPPVRQHGADRSLALSAIASDIMSLAERCQSLVQSGQPRRDEGRPRRSEHRFAMIDGLRSYLRARSCRSEHFPPGLFADPAWDMLLDLYLARSEGRPVSVSSLCIAAGVPPTTALRWQCQLEKNGLIKREKDNRDARRVFLSLTSVASQAIENWMDDVTRQLERSDH